MLRTWLWVPIVALTCACNHRPASPATSGSTTSTSVARPKPAASAPPAAHSAAPPVARQTDVLATSAGDVRITPLHHATLLLEMAGKAVYFDPTHDADYAGLPKAVAIFITHAHHDHFDPRTIEKLSTAETIVIAPPVVAEQLPKGTQHVHVMKNGDATNLKAAVVPAIPALAVEAVPAYNKVRGPAPGKLYHPKGVGNGYVLSFGGKRIYVSGDTACTDEMKALSHIDVAFVCMNLPYTMPPSEAAACIRAFRPKVVYPYHYRGSDPSEVSRALAGLPIEVRLRKWY